MTPEIRHSAISNLLASSLMLSPMPPPARDRYAATCRKLPLVGRFAISERPGACEPKMLTSEASGVPCPIRPSPHVHGRGRVTSESVVRFLVRPPASPARGRRVRLPQTGVWPSVSICSRPSAARRTCCWQFPALLVSNLGSEHLRSRCAYGLVPIRRDGILDVRGGSNFAGATGIKHGPDTTGPSRLGSSDPYCASPKAGLQRLHMGGFGAT